MFQCHSSSQSLMIRFIKHFSQKWLLQKCHNLVNVVLRLGIHWGLVVVFDGDGGLKNCHMSFSSADLDVGWLAEQALVLFVVVFQCFHYFGKWGVELLVDVELRVFVWRSLALVLVISFWHTKIIGKRWGNLRLCLRCTKISDRSLLRKPLFFGYWALYGLCRWWHPVW